MSTTRLLTKKEDIKMKTSAIFSLIAIAMTLNLKAANNDGDLNNATTTSAYFLETLDMIEEKTLDVSDWMLDVESFREPKVLVEDWMLEESFFEEHEDILEIDETWMFNVDAFLGMETDFEEDINEVEEWMFLVTSFSDDFKEEISPIEEWMFNF